MNDPAHRRTSSGNGFTLVELMVTVALVAIIAAIAIPTYRNYVLRANRVDATSALLRLAAAQEKFYLQNGIYAADAQLAAPPPAGLGFDGTERGFYDIEVAPAPGGLTVGFRITATASGPPQADDTQCQTFSIDESGKRGSAPEKIDVCWK